jgi:hypothetical protein
MVGNRKRSTEDLMHTISDNTKDKSHSGTFGIEYDKV